MFFQNRSKISVLGAPAPALSGKAEGRYRGRWPTRSKPRGVASATPHRFACPLLCAAAAVAVGEEGEEGEGGEDEGGGLGDGGYLDAVNHQVVSDIWVI